MLREEKDLRTPALKRCALIITLFLISCSNTGPTIRKLFPEKHSVNRDRYHVAVSNFSGVSLHGIGHIKLAEGQETKLEIEASEKDFENLEITIRDHTLHIDYKKPMRLSKAPIFYITYTGLESLAIEGSGSIDSDNPIIAETLTLMLSGHSYVNLEIEAKELMAKIFGSTNCQLKGETTKQVLEISGSSSYRGIDLRSKETVIDITGAGSAWVFATDTLNATLHGSSSLYYRGSPSVTQKINGSGRLQKLKD